MSPFAGCPHGLRERADKLVREPVLDDPAPFMPLTMNKRGTETDYEAKTVMLAGRRGSGCREMVAAHQGVRGPR
jgi:hypothetical protein